MLSLGSNNRQIYAVRMTITTVMIQAVLLSSANAVDEITVPVTGIIEDSCAVETPQNSIQIGEISQSGSVQIPMTIHCNVPFLYTMVSQNGGLALQNPANSPVMAGSNAFASSVPYTLSSNIPTDTGLIADTCTSSSIKTGVNGCSLNHSGTGVALPSTAKFNLSWADQTTQLLSGQYADELTITFAVRP